MNKKVTELTEATEIGNNDLLMIIQNGENKKIEYEKLNIHSYRLDITTAIEAGGQVTLPCYYKVGNDSLKVHFGEFLIKATAATDTEEARDGHYYEVGETGSISNTIQITSDWSLNVGDVLILEVQGVYENDTE